MKYPIVRFCHNLSNGALPGEGKFDIPIIKPETFEGAESVIDFNRAVSAAKKETKGVHFFVDDYRFERLWYALDTYVGILKQFRFVMTPDYSLYRNWPIAVQIYNHYRKHYIGAILQMNGVKVYPTICWSDKKSYDFCFDGEPVNSTVCISSVGTQKDKESKRFFLDGYNEMISRLNPETIVFYGNVPKECMENIVRIKPFQDTIKIAVCERG